LVFALNCCDKEFSFFEIFEDDLTEETDFILLAGVTDLLLSSLESLLFLFLIIGNWYE